MTRQPAVRGAMSRATLLFGVAGLALWAPSAAFAQDDAATKPAADNQQDQDNGNLIVVTATKREQTLQDAPVAVSVATGERIERAEIRDLKDLQTIVPSLRVTQLQASAETNFIIRGFGNGANNAGIEPSVGVFVDGVYRSRTASRVNDLPNLQRVEVLRGPQSTLFGKNASAGVISIITQEPQFTLGGSAEGSYGNYNAWVMRGYVTGPISDTLAASIAAGYASRDGYNKDLGTGHNTNQRNRWFVRGQLLFEPSSDLKVRLIADYDSLDEICCGVVNLQRSPFPGATDVIELLGGHVPDYTHPFANVVYNNYDSTNNFKNWGVSGQIDYDIGDVTLTSITAYRESHSMTSQDPDFSSADLIYPISADIRLHSFTQEFRANAKIGDMINALLGVFYIHENVDQTGLLTWGSQARPYADQLVRALSGNALSLYGAFPAPPGGTVALEPTLGFFDSGNPAKYAGQFFQQGTGNHESFTLGSDAVSVFGQLDIEVTDGLTLTFGGNFTHDKKDYSASIASSDVFSKIDFNAAAYAPFRYSLLDGGYKAQAVGTALGLGRSATAAEIFAFATGTSPAGPAGAIAYATIIAPGAAAFAGANMNNPAANPLNPLKALQYLPPFLAVPNSVEPGKLSNDDFSYTIRLAYKLGDHLNLYASYATGYKAPSINLSRDSRPLLSDAVALTTAGLTQVNQTYGTRFAGNEKSAVWEFGAKGTWRGGAANLAVFKQEIKGFQSNIFTGTGFELSNAGKQSTWGVELEAQQELVDGFRVNLGVTYLDPVYDDFVFSPVGDLSGTKPAGIPTWTVIVGGQYDLALGNGDDLILNASFHHESKVQIVDGLPGFLSLGAAAAVAAATPFTREVNEFDASLTYAFQNGLEVAVWGRNITDNRFILSIFDWLAQPFSISGYPNEPRSWGGTVRFKF